MSQKQQLRIIGGKWKSRKINFVALPGVRPTIDPTRETLFNWLAPDIVGANCLDLFAGSGALSFEALSRGANRAVIIDSSMQIISQLKATAKLLQAENTDFYCMSMPRDLAKIPEEKFNIIFVDPPFNKGLVAPTCDALAASNLLAKSALIFVEIEKSLSDLNLFPASWQILRHKIAGQVKYYLLQIN
jgi:16S rRNA (guanine966-N2)-methyltransferase